MFNLTNFESTLSFKSCYIGWVYIHKHPNVIELVDSSRESFYLKIENKPIVEKFKKWFDESFSKGIAHSLTVIKFHTETTDETEICNVIDDFVNI